MTEKWNFNDFVNAPSPAASADDLRKLANIAPNPCASDAEACNRINRRYNNGDSCERCDQWWANLLGLHARLGPYTA